MEILDVSVIIPTYNRISYLPRAIRSVLNQSQVSFELIVVDDGSTDGTREFIDRMIKEDFRIKYFYQKNQGPSAARNLGIQSSSASFIAFLDSDDEWLAKKLKAQIDFFKLHSDYLICQTEEIWIRNGKRVNPMNKHKKLSGSIFAESLPLSIVSPSCVMMRREFFDHVGLFNELLPACEDYDLWLRASARFPVGLVKQFSVIRYGGHEDQRSRQFPVMDQFRIQSLVKLIESGILSEDQRKLATLELSRKCKIVQNGALKRGKINEFLPPLWGKARMGVEKNIPPPLPSPIRYKTQRDSSTKRFGTDSANALWRTRGEEV